MGSNSEKSTDNLAELEGAGADVCAFFDLDHTVLDGSSGMLFGTHMWRKGLIPFREALSIAKGGLLYIFGGADFTATSKQMLRLLAGIPEDEMWERSQEWFDELVEPRITEESRRRVRQHQALGHHVALLSASMPYVTVPVALALGLEAGDAISTHLEIVDGIITGRPLEPMCYGENKIAWAAQYANERGIDLARSYFYTDSLTDLPMLRAVGHPVAVNPDVRLRWFSRRAGWPVVKFH
jgi:putative phosphoserine phosphatase / 1-acylglycerol-3-phosphate O-acyltransferase